jgi:cytochrome c
MRLVSLGLLVCSVGLPGCGGDVGASSGRWSGFNPGPVPAEVHRGEVVFNTFCISCHGLHGTGIVKAGPALLDTLFGPAQVSDDAMISAMDRGASQRNFSFGAMPPVQRLSREDAVQVVNYVRWLQRRANPADSIPTSSTPVR